MNEVTVFKNKAEVWRGRIEEQARGGNSVRVFCEEHQIKQHTFNYWRKRLLDLSRNGVSRRFIPIAKQASSAMRSPRILLPHGVQIDLGCDLASAAHFLKEICGVSNAKP